MSIGLNLLLVSSAGLFAIGCLALLIKRSVLVMLLGTQFMLMAGGIAFVAFARFGLGATSPNGGPTIALLAGATATCELAVGLAMAALIYRDRRTFFADEYDTG